jgi:hypothetical protein
LFGTKAVYMPPGSTAEVEEGKWIRCWITNEKTGEVEARFIQVQPGWFIARPRLADEGSR